MHSWALCSARIAADPDQDRASVVVHAQLDELVRDTGGCEIEDGPAIHPETVRRLMCNARVQAVVEDQAGNMLGPRSTIDSCTSTGGR
jgi:Domain of unknown function (DUF222)